MVCPITYGDHKKEWGAKTISKEFLHKHLLIYLVYVTTWSTVDYVSVTSHNQL